jgi:predicted thioesterase
MNFITVPPMALYELGEAIASCQAAGRDPQTLYKTGFTVGCVLKPGEDAGSPRARAQAGPLGAVFYHGVMEGTIKLDRLPPDLQAATEAYRQNVYERYEPADARYLNLHTGHLMWVRPEEEPFITKDLLAATTFTGTRDELADRVRMLPRRGLPADRHPARPRARERHGRLDRRLRAGLMDRPELRPGAAATLTYEVRESDLASALTLDADDRFPRVFATSRLVSVMEVAAARTLRPLLGPGELSVGITMDVTHTAPTALGGRVRATATFVAREGKRWVFDLVAEDEGGEIGRARHERAIVTAERLEAAAQGRKR